jgi:hypothetical protein
MVRILLQCSTENIPEMARLLTEPIELPRLEGFAPDVDPALLKLVFFLENEVFVCEGPWNPSFFGPPIVKRLADFSGKYFMYQEVETEDM